MAERLQVGYHFTTLENWRTIRNKGLVPYEITCSDLPPELAGVQGIWLWREIPKGQSLLGDILWQLVTKQQTSIVLLEVLYSAEKVAFRLTHHGSLENWVFHESDRSVIHDGPISRENISCIGQWDLLSLAENGLESWVLGPAMVQIAKPNE